MGASARNVFPATFSLSPFDGDPEPDVERFVAINRSCIVFNADLVAAFSFTAQTATAASIRLHLRDGTPEERHFVYTPAGVVESPATDAARAG